jgi:MSHA biogenesis protein MshQ
VCLSEFSGGSATWTGNYTFAASPTAQTQLRIRATDSDGATSANLPAGVGKEPVLLIRSGRVRLTNGFGGIGRLDLPVSIEYYTGQAWVRNSEDSTTAFTANAVSVGTNAALGTVTATLSKPFANGSATLSLTPPPGARRGSVPYAVNLGGATGANTSCYYNTAAPNMGASTGAQLAFLRSRDASCNRNNVDPSALATFGVYAPETKRIIHVREVFR